MRNASLVLGATLLASWILACSEDDSKRSARRSLDASAEGAAGSSAGGGGAGEAGRQDAGAGAGGQAGSMAGGPNVDGGAGAAGTGGMAGAGGIAGASGAGGGAGAPDASTGADLYVSPSGSDAALGTASDPFLTIAHAATLAGAGDRIVLLDGTFDGTTQPTFNGLSAIAIADGVTLRAANAGAAVLVGTNGPGFDLAGGGAIDGLRFRTFGVAVRGSTGAIAITGTTFTDCGGPGVAPVTLTGSAAVTIRPAGVASYLAGATYGFVDTSGTATAVVEGGAVTGVTGGAASGRGLFTARESSTIELDAVTMTDVPMETVYAEGAATVLLSNNTVVQGTKSPALAVVELQGSASFTMRGSRFESSYWAGISTIGTPTVVLEASEIRSSGAWGIIVNAPGPVNLNLTGTTLAANTNHHVELRAPATVTVTDSQLVDGAALGLNVGGVVASLSMRGTTVTGNGGGGIVANAAAGSTIDLGVVGDAGRNTFRNNGTSPGLVSYLPAPGTAFAVGNTWTPGAQGADGSGAYSAVGPGAILEITGPSAPGSNHQVVPTGAKLRLAENL